MQKLQDWLKKVEWKKVGCWGCLALVLVSCCLLALGGGIYYAVTHPATAATSPKAEVSEGGAPVVSNPITGTQGTMASGWTVKWYRSPFRAVTDQLKDEATQETFAEPGVLLDDTAAFDYLSALVTPLNAPEGAYAYAAFGEADLIYGDTTLNLPWRERNIYLLIVRGLPSDGNPNTDLNQQVWLAGYKRGFGIYSPMPAGAYVSLGWMVQQIQNGLGKSPNCGSQGCKTATVVVFDLATKTYRMWMVADLAKPREWTRVK